MNNSIINVENDCVKVIDDLISIVNQDKRTMDISLVGGALRDLILENNNISDIDLLICLNDKMTSFTDFSYDFSNSVELSKYRNYEKNYVNKISNELKLLGYEVKTYLFFDDKLDGEDYEVDEKQAVYDTNQELYGVLKVKHPTLNYDVDLLFVLNSYNYVLDKFDFNICKVEAPLIYASNKNLYEKGKWITNTIVPYQNFLNDVKNKEIKYVQHDSSMENIQKSFEVHFPKIKKKYPDFNLKLEFFAEKNRLNKDTEYCDILKQYIIKNRVQKEDFILKQAQMAQIRSESTVEVNENFIKMKRRKI